MRPEPKAKADDGQLDLEAFLPYRLSLLSNMVSSRIAKSYEQQFQLTILEWRVMAVLGRFPGLTAAEVAERTAMDKVQVSRAVARLHRTLRIERRGVAGDLRARQLFLSGKGLEVYAEIVPLARAYEAKVTAGLTLTERMQLDRLLDKLTVAARNLGTES